MRRGAWGVWGSGDEGGVGRLSATERYHAADRDGGGDRNGDRDGGGGGGGG